MTEKQTPISRALIAASKMPAPQARRILMLICKSGMTMDVPQPTQGEIHYSKREKFIKRMKSSCDCVFNYARHETLRKIEKHFRDNPSISAAESGDAAAKPPSSLAVRLTFDKALLSEELLAALAEDQQAALGTAGQQLFDEIGKDSVWRLPSQDAIQFVQDRANLLANVPDEVHAEIMQSIEQGLQHGESRKELMARISAAFDEIGRARAETIANTETAAAFNYSRDKAMREAGVTHKKWLHSMSPLIKEPRPTHLEADGQTVPIDEPFDVGGVSMMHPGDESAGPEEVINCMCTAIPTEAPIESAGEKEGHPFRGNQYTAGETSGQAEGQAIVDRKQRMEQIRKRGNAMAARMDFPTDKIDYLETGDPVKFNVGDRQFTRGGFYSPSNGRITIDSTTIADHPASIDSMMAHEVSHAQFDTVKQAQELEHARISTILKNDKEFGRHFTAGGFVRPESKAYFADKFPVSTAMARTWGDSYLEGSGHMKTAEMIKDDGISDYSKAYWAKGAVDQNFGLSRAVDETVAEVNSWAHTGAVHLSRPSRDWEQFTRDIRVQYKRIKHPYVEISKWEK